MARIEFTALNWSNTNPKCVIDAEASTAQKAQTWRDCTLQQRYSNRSWPLSFELKIAVIHVFEQEYI